LVMIGFSGDAPANTEKRDKGITWTTKTD
jgi:hypothetical protein